MQRAEIGQLRVAAGAVQDCAQHATWIGEEVLVADEQPALARVAQKHDQREQVRHPQVHVRAEQTLRTRRLIPRVERRDDVLRIAHEKEQEQVDTGHLLELAGARRIVRGVNDEARARGKRDRAVEILGDAPVAR